MHYHSEALIKDLSAKAQSYRIQVLKMVNKAQTGHIGGAFSSAEILTALFSPSAH
jgi:transketolase N-terminal domain/subunit